MACYNAGMMQKIATRIFIGASVAFGILGALNVLLSPNENSTRFGWEIVLFKSFMLTVFIILPSFALSVAGKYLRND